MDALQLYLPLIASVLGSGTFTAIFVQLRLWHRDHSRLKFARYVFDHTRSTDALGGFARLVHGEPQPVPHGEDGAGAARDSTGITRRGSNEGK